MKNVIIEMLLCNHRGATWWAGTHEFHLSSRGRVLWSSTSRVSLVGGGGGGGGGVASQPLSFLLFEMSDTHTAPAQTL